MHLSGHDQIVDAQTEGRRHPRAVLTYAAGIITDREADVEGIVGWG
jgi:hypothetical protein